MITITKLPLKLNYKFSEAQKQIKNYDVPRKTRKVNTIDSKVGGIIRMLKGGEKQ